MAKFADQENLDLSYELPPGEVRATLETLAEQAALLVDRFGDEEAYSELKNFCHLEQVLEEPGTFP